MLRSIQVLRLMDKILHDLRTLNYGNYGIFLIMGNAGFCPSTVGFWAAISVFWMLEVLKKNPGVQLWRARSLRVYKES